MVHIYSNQNSFTLLYGGNLWLQLITQVLDEVLDLDENKFGAKIKIMIL